MKGVIGYISACALCAVIGCSGGGGGGGTGPASTVNTLSSLELSNITLSPAFAAATTEYTAAAGNSVQSITVTPTASDPAAAIEVNSETVNSGSASSAIALTLGSNTVTVEVTAQSGDVKTYTVTVTKSDTPGAKTAYTIGGVSFALIGATASVVASGGIKFPTLTDNSGTGTISAPFMMAETDTTYELWQKVYVWATDPARGADKYTFANPGENGSDDKNSYKGFNTSLSTQYPVTWISWRDAMVWCNALTEYYNASNGAGTDLDVVYYSEYDSSLSVYKKPIRTSTSSTTITATTAGSQDNPYVNASAKGFRLPTSTEYEFSARYIGPTAPKNTNVVEKDGVYYTNGASASGATAECTDNVATSLVAVFYRNYTDASTYTPVTGTAVVKSKAKNVLGLYDMSGNVWKLNFDWHPSHVDSSRVAHGGAFFGVAAPAQVGNMINFDPYYAERHIGFRFARNY